jgi:hypothetical protein
MKRPPRFYSWWMDTLEFFVHGELFRVSERWQPSGMVSYDFAWLNGPNGGTYGFTVGLAATGPAPDARLTREQLVDEARGFIEGFYAPGGIGQEDFPDHTPAHPRNADER